MKAERLTVQGFRNLVPQSIELTAGINVFYGNNGQGKTNCLEAMWLFTGGHSFRSSKDSQLIAFGAKESQLTLSCYSEQREQILDLSLSETGRRFEKNGVPLSSGASLMGTFCGVIFAPEHLALVKEGPSKRRSFLDGALCQSYPHYAKEFVEYQRVLKQRNQLLKTIQQNSSLQPTLAIWNEALAEKGVQVTRRRMDWLQQLKDTAALVYSGISQGAEVLSLAYVSSIRRETLPTKEEFLAKLEEVEERDILYGSTSVGPHRDDVEILLDDMPARLYGSQGQQRSAVLALKLAEANALEAALGEPPVILLDDVMSELDSSRQTFLLQQMETRQMVCTCCDPSILPLKKDALFLVERGHVTRQT